MRVTVIGAGIIGLSIAYRLAGRGCEVTVVNRTETHSGASYNNAGWLEFHAVSGGLDQLRRTGVEIELLDGNGARDLVPELPDEVAHAIFFPTHRHVQPETIIDGLVSRCRALGVRFVGGSIDQVTVRASGAIELCGTAEPIEADTCVVAAGIWSRRRRSWRRSAPVASPELTHVVAVAAAPGRYQR